MHRIGLPALALAALATASTLVHSSAATFAEDFAADPATRGWQAFGDTNLFQWDAANQNLQVTWDSSQPNSFFAHPLPFTLTSADNFSLGFDLHLSDFVSGLYPGKPYPEMELAVGLLNLGEAVQTNFWRGAYLDCCDLVEFDFFPDNANDSWDGWIWGPSVTATVIDWTGANYYTGGFGGWSLDTNNVFHVVLTYSSSDRILRSSVTVNGQPFATIPDAQPTSSFQGFFVDHLAVCSFSDGGQDPSFAGSILAHGWVDSFSLDVYSSPLAGQFAGGAWQVQCLSVTNRLYTLERSTDFQNWGAVSPATAGNGTNLVLSDPAPPAGRAFYRARVVGE